MVRRAVRLDLAGPLKPQVIVAVRTALTALKQYAAKPLLAAPQLSPVRTEHGAETTFHAASGRGDATLYKGKLNTSNTKCHALNLPARMVKPVCVSAKPLFNR